MLLSGPRMPNVQRDVRIAKHDIDTAAHAGARFPTLHMMADGASKGQLSSAREELHPVTDFLQRRVHVALRVSIQEFIPELEWEVYHLTRLLHQRRPGQFAQRQTRRMHWQGCGWEHEGCRARRHGDGGRGRRRLGRCFGRVHPWSGFEVRRRVHASRRRIANCSQDTKIRAVHEERLVHVTQFSNTL